MEGVQLDQETFCCSICLDQLKDPVTIPCGHSYCKSCIKAHWDGEDEKKIYSCPQCRQTFTPRPVLGKNIMLADLVARLKKTGLQAAAADLCYAGPEDVSCDVCTGRKRKALKSCLQCLISYCENHLQPHYNVGQFKKHKLVDPSKKLQENICSRHDEVMKMFCRTDQQSICYLCSVDEHKGHDTVSAAAERTERQRELEMFLQDIQQGIQDREKDVKLLQQKLEAVSRFADKAVEDSEKIFTELIRLFQKRSSDVKQQIRSQQETEVSLVKDFQEELQQEISELKRKDAELKREYAELKRKDAELKLLSHRENHYQFLRNYPPLSRFSEATDSSCIKVQDPLRYFEDVTEAVSELDDYLQDTLRDKWTNISLPVLLQSQLEPKTRAEFLKYACEVTLDPNTAHRQVLLSEGNRKAECDDGDSHFHDGIRIPRKDRNRLGRFAHHFQVLSKEGLTGRCYWEVEMHHTGILLAVAYKNGHRAGLPKEHQFGCNDKSWMLCLNDEISEYSLTFNNIKDYVIEPPYNFCDYVSRVGVYLDHEAGILSFYSVSQRKNMTLLHRLQTTFTEPLHAGLCFYYDGSTAEFIKLK